MLLTVPKIRGYHCTNIYAVITVKDTKVKLYWPSFSNKIYVVLPLVIITNKMKFFIFKSEQVIWVAKHLKEDWLIVLK